jgi:hypothetical protein
MAFSFWTVIVSQQPSSRKREAIFHLFVNFYARRRDGSGSFVMTDHQDLQAKDLAT